MKRPTLLVAGEEFPNQRAVMVDDPKAPGGQRLTFTGPMANVLAYVAKGTNFSYTYERPHDRAWGSIKADGSWSGMVGLVITEKVTFALGPFGATTGRAKVVDFSWPITIDDWRIMGGRGRPEVDPWGFLLPLAPLVWATILTTLLLLSAIVCVSYFCISHKTLTPNNWSEGTFGYIRVLLQQGERDVYMKMLLI
ncbi:glutamate receptor-like [Homarus americanus]|uniref:glutamate receptor-like n=1 Tax=Homarus americanus TaxID=6706 RepID=UPI001C45A428|nr:glutamate receptor-like [Homarus americanus]